MAGCAIADEGEEQNGRGIVSSHLFNLDALRLIEKVQSSIEALFKGKQSTYLLVLVTQKFLDENRH